MFVKRSFDLIFSFFNLILSFPLIIIISISIKIFQGGPIFFNQTRIGKNNKEFKLFKFCTMTNEKNSKGLLLSDKERTSKIGSFLRRSSLDEIPSFLNVIFGEMSIIGPRPLLVRYLERYSDEQIRRHNVKPGITGWAQINGRNAISWKKKFELDVWYVDNQSFLLDIKIFFLTIIKVILRKNITPENHDSMEEFFGN